MVDELLKWKNDKISLAMVVYNESPTMINRALQSVKGLVERAVILFHKNYPFDMIDQLINPSIEPLVILRENLDNSIVEEWRNVVLKECYIRGYYWTLILDPDEYLDAGAQNFLKVIKGSWDDEREMVGGFYFPRNNIEINRTNGKVIEMSGYPDYQIRLVRPSYRYSGEIHQQIDITSPFLIKRALGGNIVHDKSGESYEEWKRKLLLYRSKGGKDNVKMEI